MKPTFKARVSCDHPSPRRSATMLSERFCGRFGLPLKGYLGLWTQARFCVFVALSAYKSQYKHTPRNSMFATHPIFMIPVTFGDGIVVWRAVELDIHTPWLIATVQDPHEPPERTFLLSGCDELLDFANSVQFGSITAPHLVQPPIWSKSRDWGLFESDESRAIQWSEREFDNGCLDRFRWCSLWRVSH